MNEEKSGYGKMPLWQWILLYVVIGGAIYAAVYYFAFGAGGYSYTAPAGSVNPVVAPSGVNLPNTGSPAAPAPSGNAPAYTPPF
jgi:hypothetical protein